MKLGLIGINDLGLSFGLLCEKNGYEVLVSNNDEDYIFNLNQKKSKGMRRAYILFLY